MHPNTIADLQASSIRLADTDNVELLSAEVVRTVRSRAPLHLPLLLGDTKLNADPGDAFVVIVLVIFDKVPR